jgi:hypothetical protein
LVAQAEVRAGGAALNQDYDFARELAADRAVAQGAAMLGERQSVFATTTLHEAAGRFSMGRVGNGDIAVALSRAQVTTAIYTNDRTKLATAIQERSGIKQTALAPAANATAAKSAASGFKGLAL